ncbi:hypothetical protein V8D89_000810 [Ganoderma adspersum]
MTVRSPVLPSSICPLVCSSQTPPPTCLATICLSAAFLVLLPLLRAWGPHTTASSRLHIYPYLYRARSPLPPPATRCWPRGPIDAILFHPCPIHVANTPSRSLCTRNGVLGPTVMFELRYPVGAVGTIGWLTLCFLCVFAIDSDCLERFLEGPVMVDGAR